MMSPVEKALLLSEAGIAEPDFAIRTATRIDAGRWWRRTPVWLCIAGDELVMLAVARRRYLERISIAGCSDSHYNHSTGELVIAPGEGLLRNRFAMTPREALSILKILTKKKEQTLTEPTT